MAQGDLDNAPVTPELRGLLTFVAQVTRHAYKTADADVEQLRALGWTDPQIAECVYITALFAFFNRVADAFGLEDPGYHRQPIPIRPRPAANLAETAPDPPTDPQPPA